MRSRNVSIQNALLAVALIAYTAAAGRYCSGKEREIGCAGLDIQVVDSMQAGFVSAEIIKGWLRDSLGQIVGTPLKDVDVYAVERLVGSKDYVSRAQAYTAMDGLLHVRVWQRRPLLRVVSESGHNFYIDSTLTLLPPRSYYLAPVPVVSGKVPVSVPADYYGPLEEKKYARDKDLLHNLLNFVNQVSCDEFLKALVMQIYYEGPKDLSFSGGDLLLLPRVGTGQRVRFGEIRDDAEAERGGELTIRQRLDKLSRFYKSSFSDGWWRRGEGGEVNVKFRGQVIVSGGER